MTNADRIEPGPHVSALTARPRILVPIERSNEARAAFAGARRLARWLDAEIDLLHVLDLEDFLPSDGHLDQPLRSEADLRDWLEVDERMSLRCWIDLGDPRERILARAWSGNYQAMVLGTRGRQGLLRAVAGSITESVLRGAPCPVMTVHGGWRNAPDSAGKPALLCAVDLSAVSTRIVEQALALRERTGGHLTLLHVTLPGESPTAGQDRQAWRALEQRFALDPRASLELRTGTASAEIVATLTARPFDLLVMGSHGRTGLDRLMMGSVAEDVIRAAPSPVLVVPRSSLGPRSGH